MRGVCACPLYKTYEHRSAIANAVATLINANARFPGAARFRKLVPVGGRHWSHAARTLQAESRGHGFGEGAPGFLDGRWRTTRGTFAPARHGAPVRVKGIKCVRVCWF